MTDPNGLPPEKDDYLWDGSGDADPDVVRLEQQLAPLAYRRPAPEVAVAAEKPVRGIRTRASARRWRLPVTAFAVLAAAAALALWWSRRGGGREAEPGRAAWAVKTLAGAPSRNGRQLAPGARLGEGQWLETDKASRAALAVADIGTVELAPETRVRLVRTGPSEHRLQLARGEISARIAAPPRLFVVETPSGDAVDLGCAYTLRVDARGGAELHVTSGWVALPGATYEAIVPAGAECHVDPIAGPGIPMFEDADPALRTALTRWQLTRADEALGEVLAVARPRDSLTLFHMLLAIEPERRSAVLGQLEQLGVVWPAGATREGLLAHEPASLAALKDALASDWMAPMPPAPPPRIPDIPLTPLPLPAPRKAK